MRLVVRTLALIASYSMNPHHKTTPEILDFINKGLEDAGVPENSDMMRVIEEEVWEELEEERDLGEITPFEAETLYYNWINKHHKQSLPSQLTLFSES